MTKETAALLKQWAETYNDRQYFQEDPIIFPTRFAELMRSGRCDLKDVEVSAIFAAHFACAIARMVCIWCL